MTLVLLDLANMESNSNKHSSLTGWGMLMGDVELRIREAIRSVMLLLCMVVVLFSMGGFFFESELLVY